MSEGTAYFLGILALLWWTCVAALPVVLLAKLLF